MKKIVLMSLAVIACGGAVVPVPGDTCAAGTDPKCVVDATDGGNAALALFCESGKWAQFPCENQCSTVTRRDGGTLASCTLALPRQAGQPCPLSDPWAAYLAQCYPAQANKQSSFFRCSASGVVEQDVCTRGCDVAVTQCAP